MTSLEKKMDSGLLASLMQQCVDAGFISLDGSSAIDDLVTRKLPSTFDLQIDLSSASLHPLTFIVSAATDVKTSMRNWLVPTEFLKTAQGQDFLYKTFV